VNDARLIVRPGMTGATGNVYVGLHELEEMAFLLHALRPTDLFVDVGANVGSYTVLASKGVGARCVSFEPVPSSFATLRDNVLLNGVEERVELHAKAVGSEDGTISFTLNYDTCNRVATSQDQVGDTLAVDLVALDSLASVREACIVKIDVEGFERAVLTGARKLLDSPTLLAIIMETLGGQGASAHATAHDLALELGFSPHTYSPFDRRLISLGRGYKSDGNTIYVRDLAKLRERIETGPTFQVLGLRV
jgi:FkbM family methyltransferase